jgi:uncharacterized protein
MSLTSKKKQSGLVYLRAIMLATSLLLPSLSLIILGSYWLWQNSYLIIWAISASVFTLFIFLLESYALKDLLPDKTAVNMSDEEFTSSNDRERAAWAEVQAFASRTKTTDISDKDTALAIAIQTIEKVAKQLHPDDKSPLLRFTVPEALAVVERVSGQLGPFVADHIPLGDRLTVRQMVSVYRWRTAADVALKAYDLWRIVRLLNPTAALANEVRERVAGQLIDQGREEVAKRLTRAYIETVGRAAIDLYSGRLAVRHAETEAIVDSAVAPTLDEKKPQPPVRRSRLWSQIKNAVSILRQ